MWCVSLPSAAGLFYCRAAVVVVVVDVVPPGGSVVRATKPSSSTSLLPLFFLFLSVRALPAFFSTLDLTLQLSLNSAPIFFFEWKVVTKVRPEVLLGLSGAGRIWSPKTIQVRERQKAKEKCKGGRQRGERIGKGREGKERERKSIGKHFLPVLVESFGLLLLELLHRGISRALYG